jgi:tRNA pseudouridine55 synthase
VVARVRRLASQRRVGHAGTLDPLADGVLPVLLGRAARLADFIHDGSKTYVAVVRLGVGTETDDAEGAIVLSTRVPPLTESLLEQTLAPFRGAILQTPPKYSALKVAGRRAYAVARAGGAVDLPPRCVVIHELFLRGWTPTELTLEITCSKGTYIRSLARDIAAAIGTVGHLSSLKRTRVGPFLIENALTLEEIADRTVASVLLTPRCAIPDAPTFHADSEQAARLRNGQPVAVTDLCADAVWVYDPDDTLVCLASADDEWLRPRIAL